MQIGQLAELVVLLSLVALFFKGKGDRQLKEAVNEFDFASKNTSFFNSELFFCEMKTGLEL